MPTCEDKVLQRAVARLLEPLYEEAFYDFSYGFRPGRSPHQALETFWQEATGLGVRWVLEVDIRKYFDSVHRSNLLGLVGQRIGDGGVLRLLSKWLHAGVREGGQVHYPEAGTPQGGVVTPPTQWITLSFRSVCSSGEDLSLACRIRHHPANRACT